MNTPKIEVHQYDGVKSSLHTGKLLPGERGYAGGESATPRTDALLIDCLNSNRFRVEHMADFARQLERETATLHAQIARLKQREGELEMLLEGGAGRIARERHRHVTQEGYDAAHDDEHTYGTIRVVAAMLACNGTDASVSDPLDRDDWNLGRHPLERRLEIAGALLAAELDRLARAALQSVAKERDELRAELLTTHQMACRVGLERDELRAKQGEAP